MKLSTATLLAVVLPTVAIAFQQPAAIRYNGVKLAPVMRNTMPTTSFSTTSSSTSLVMAAETAAASEEGGAEEKSTGSKLFNAYVKTAGVATTLFPLWTVLFTGAALASPQSFAWFTTEYFTAALAALMLSMGITLTPQDFLDVMKEPASVAMQFTLCYAMMPLLALGLGKLFGLDSAMLAGMVLVGSINGGQASNLCTYIARGNVALSVLMTTATTVGAIFMTPLICKGLLGTVVPVDAAGIAFSTIQVVLGPIAVGMATNKFFPGFVKKILPITPVVGVLSTCMLVASAVAQVTEPILNAGLQLQTPIFLLHLIGGLVGYGLPKLTGFGEVKSRTMAIETSMKSSAFGFLLAKLHFGQYAARVPSAVSVVWMALTGSMLAVIWRYIPVKEGEE
jgi:BASS family bile acid:Na+ symporter